MIDIIKNSFPFLLEKELLDEMSSVCSLKKVSVGDALMRKNSAVRYVPLMLSGLVKVIRRDENGNELFLYYIEGGEACASSFSCCMQIGKSQIEAIAEEDSEMIIVPIEKIEEWMKKYRSWREFVITSFSIRLDELFKTIDMIAFKKMDERLLDYLNNKSIMLGSKELLTTHQLIAEDLNSSREVISRLLKTLEKEGLISLGRNKIQLK